MFCNLGLVLLNLCIYSSNRGILANETRHTNIYNKYQCVDINGMETSRYVYGTFTFVSLSASSSW